MSEEKDRFKVGDKIYISNWFHQQPKDQVVEGEIVNLVKDCWLKWIRYEALIRGRKFLIGNYSSPDVWGSRIFKRTSKKIYIP